MAVSDSALTLSQYAIMSNDPLVQAITYSLLEQASILEDLPIITRKTLKVSGVRWEGNLPTPNWRKLNAEPTVTSGTPTPYEEQVYIVSNALDIDKLIVQDENQIVDPRASQLDAYLKAVNYDINDKFFNNNHIGGNEDAPVGIRVRLDNPSTYGVASELKINGGGVDMTQAAMTAATANNFIEYVDQLLDYLGTSEGNGVTLYMNDTMKRRFARAIRILGAGAGFRTDQDAFGRSIDKYKNARVTDIGRKADQSTRIITTTEGSTGLDASSTYTSIYGVRYGTEALMGWQFDTLKGEDIGMIANAGTIYRTLVDWAVGLLATHTRCMGRIYGIKLS